MALEVATDPLTTMGRWLDNEAPSLAEGRSRHRRRPERRIPVPHPGSESSIRPSGPSALRQRVVTLPQHPWPGRQVDYVDLFLSLVQRWLAALDEHGSRAFLPGMGSRQGTFMDGLEGFARMAPLLAAWVGSGRRACLSLESGRSVDLIDVLARGFRAGCHPDHPGSWGRMGAKDQRIVEAADLALALWIARDELWTSLSSQDQGLILAWLDQVRGLPVHDNNWHLFPVFVELVVERLGGPPPSTARGHYERFLRFHAGDGWFRDGPRGPLDYYNAWAIHYLLFWIDTIAPDWDPAFIHQAQHNFLPALLHLISPAGIPILGRSLCYRMAIPAPLVLTQARPDPPISPGAARRALDATWAHFLSRGAVRDGRVTQGYFQDDARLLDRYSGTGSCQLSLRSLVAAFLQPEAAPFWTLPPEPLPIERDSYRLTVAAGAWEIMGEQKNGKITIHLSRPHRTWPGSVRLRRHGPVRLWLERITGIVSRPSNQGAKYGLPLYSNQPPFCVDPGQQCGS